MPLFNKFRKKKAWMIEVTDIDTNISEVAGYFYSRSKAELVCNAANQYTASTRLHYEILG